MTSSPTIIGRYEIRGRIGQGGMGVLYRAWDPRLERQVAIKLLIGDNPELRERFAREARSAARLRHPHIVLIFDVGEHEGQPFIAMEYIQGQTLGEMINARAGLSLVRKLELIEELCDGLAFAHRTGVIHRDIKPANAMVDANGALKILDFGIARLTESSGMTQSGMLIGTLNYMSPEQVMGREIDNRSDIFAVGALFYELLACRQAFPGGLQNGILNRILQGQREPVETVCPGLDPDVVRVVDQALELDPERRYQDLTVMRKDLQRVRFRLEQSLTEPTGLNRPQRRSAPVAPTPVATPSPSPRRTAAREDLERRRTTQIEAKLEEAKRAFAAKDFDTALALSEEALLLDADHARAIELHDQSRTALDERHANELLDGADRERRLGALTAALSIIDRADAIFPTLPRAIELRNAIDGELRAREEARRRAERVRQAVDLASASFDAGQFTQAIAAADQALALDPTLVEAISIKSRAADAIKVRERQAEERRLEAERRAKQQRIVAELHAARVEIGRHQFPGAISRLQRLEAAEGSSAEISAAIREAQAGQAALEQAADTANQVRAHLANAESLFARRELTAALGEADNACALDPKHKTALALRSRIWDAVHRAEEERRSEARRLAEAESRRLADAEARRLAEADAQRLAEAEAKRIGDVEARRLADAEARRRAETEARRLADAEARRLAEADARRAAEAVSRVPAPQPESEPPTLVSGHTGAAASAPAPVITPAALGPTLTPGRSLNPMYLGAAAVAVLIIGIGGYFLTGRGPGDVRRAETPGTPATSAMTTQPGAVASPSAAATPPPVVTAPVTAPPSSAPPASTGGKDNLEEALKRSRNNARAQLARGARPEALGSTTEGLKLAPNDAQLRKLLDEMLREARTRLAAARAAAAAGGRQTSSSPSTTEAARLEQEAVRLERRQEIDPAIRAMWLAADAYVKVGEEARRAPARAEAPSAAPALQPLASQRPFEQSPVVVSRGTTPAESATAPPPAGAAVPAPTPATVDERPAVSRVLRAYEQAYADLSPNAVAKLYPGVDVDGLKRGFDQLRSMQVQLQNEQIRIEGATAVATGTWVTIARAKVGAAQQASAPIELRLQKSQSGWTIVSRSMR
jgi:eukaryotic-like serine/threonine-protein kinase